MPDADWQTVSASQAPALFGQSPYITKWMLHQAFKKRDLSMLEPASNERMNWGTLLQDDILEATAAELRLEVLHNVANEYMRNGQLGATVDGITIAPDLGPIVVESKNIDWLRWRDTWTETAAAPHVEIQLQTQMLAATPYYGEIKHGIIAALVGGNDLKLYRRERNAELHERLVEEAAHFFDDLTAGREPDPLGSPLELPMLASLYPETTEQIVEDMTDLELAYAIRTYAAAAEERKFQARLEEQMKAKIMARAGAAGRIIANGGTVYISRATIAPGMCAPHTDSKQIRKGYVRTELKVVATDPVTPIDDGKLSAGDVA